MFEIATMLAALAAQAPATPATAKIVLYRNSTVIGAAIACPIRYQGREVVELARGRFAEWHVAPGRYTLGNKSKTVDVTVGPGETQYVRCTIKAGFLAGGSNLKVVDQQTFAEHQADYKQKEVNPEFLSTQASATAVGQ